jgi:hypothetical protein
MRYKGGRVSAIHIGVTKRIRKNNVVRAGLVVAEVAVLWVDKKSVSSTSGSRRILQRVVKVLIASTISSRLSCRCAEPSEAVV